MIRKLSGDELARQQAAHTKSIDDLHTDLIKTCDKHGWSRMHEVGWMQLCGMDRRDADILEKFLTFYKQSWWSDDVVTCPQHEISNSLGYKKGAARRGIDSLCQLGLISKLGRDRKNDLVKHRIDISTLQQIVAETIDRKLERRQAPSTAKRITNTRSRSSHHGAEQERLDALEDMVVQHGRTINQLVDLLHNHGMSLDQQTDVGQATGIPASEHPVQPAKREIFEGVAGVDIDTLKTRDFGGAAIGHPGAAIGHPGAAIGYISSISSPLVLVIKEIFDKRKISDFSFSDEKSSSSEKSSSPEEREMNSSNFEYLKKFEEKMKKETFPQQTEAKKEASPQQKGKITKETETIIRESEASFDPPVPLTPPGEIAHLFPLIYRRPEPEVQLTAAWLLQKQKQIRDDFLVMSKRLAAAAGIEDSTSVYRVIWSAGERAIYDCIVERIARPEKMPDSYLALHDPAPLADSLLALVRIWKESDNKEGAANRALDNWFGKQETWRPDVKHMRTLIDEWSAAVMAGELNIADVLVALELQYLRKQDNANYARAILDKDFREIRKGDSIFGPKLLDGLCREQYAKSKLRLESSYARSQSTIGYFVRAKQPPSSERGGPKNKKREIKKTIVYVKFGVPLIAEHVYDGIDLFSQARLEHLIRLSVLRLPQYITDRKLVSILPSISHNVDCQRKTTETA